MPEMADHAQLPLDPPAVATDQQAPVAVGDQVISWHTDDPAEYGGPPSHRGLFEVIISFGAKGHVLKCDPQAVAPASTHIPPRDDRVQAVKRERTEKP